MKSQYVDTLPQVAAWLFEDFQATYPQDGGFVKDLATLTRLFKERGIGLFQFDLPHLEGLLLAGLRDGRLILQGPLTKVVSKKIQVPRFLSGLWLRVFDKTGCLKEEVDVNALLFIRQICTVGKRLELPCSPKRMQESLNEYRVVDQGLRSPSLDWESDHFDIDRGRHSVHFCDIVAADTGTADLPFGGSNDPLSEHDTTLLATLQQVADKLSATLGNFNPISASCEGKRPSGAGRGFRHGPGAVAHKSGTVDKYDMPNLSNKLLRVFPRIFMIPKGTESVTRNHEVPARLCAVPKTAKAPRLIAAEPVEHQWCQQLLLNWFNNRFKEHFPRSIDLSDQEASRELARRGSLSGDLVTVDLSSASDRLSCWTVERIFRCSPNTLSALQAVRTRWVTNQIPGTQPYFLKLKKYASQGTACTFPVQTFVFMTIAVSALVAEGQSTNQWRNPTAPTLTDGMLRRAIGKVRVFGDDIIMPTTGYANLIRLITLLQLKVNEDKSFAQGFFRESCGGDFYRGFDVTPVKVKRIGSTGPDLRASLLDSSNNFFKKGFWKTAQGVGYLLGHRLKHMPIVSIESGTRGLQSYCGGWYAHLPLRWNNNLHTVEYRSWGFTSKQPASDRPGRSRLRKFLLENPIRRHMDCDPYTSDLLERGKSGDGLAWRALDPLQGFRANRLS